MNRGVLLTPMEKFRRRVDRWSARLHATPRRITVMRMTRKWASCSSRGRICFAHDLLELSERQQDYVIVHELLHLRHPNHSKVFTALCRAHLKRPVPPPKIRRSAG